MMDLGIAGRWALIGGASKGLGFGCAKALVEEGVNVVIVARTANSLDAAKLELLETARRCAERENFAVPEVIAVAGDITSPAGQAAALAAHPQFDILINNAGGPAPGDFRQWNRDQWIAALEANMLAPIELIRKQVDGMCERGFGRIVNITSSAVKAPIDILGLSNGARSGLTGFVAGLARSAIAAQGVTVNNLLPGAFDTDRLAATLAAQARNTGIDVHQAAQIRLKTIPAGRFGTAEEFGKVCAFLCSQQAAYLTGQNILLDGGAYPGAF